MKKFIWFLAGMMFATSISVFALSEVDYFFNDEESFEGTWYHEAAMSMLYRDIIRGGDNYNFNAAGLVNRAQMAVMLDRTIDYLEWNRNSAIRSNNYNLLEALSDLDLLSNATVEKVAYVSVSLGEHQYDDEMDFGVDFLVDGCSESNLVLDDDIFDGYIVYYCDTYFYIYDEINDLLYGQF